MLKKDKCCITYSHKCTGCPFLNYDIKICMSFGSRTKHKKALNMLLNTGMISQKIYDNISKELEVE